MNNIETNVEIPHFSERMAKITAKAERDRAKQREKEKKEQQELTKALEAVDELAPRIKALIEMANACKREDIEFPTDTEPYGYGYTSYDGKKGYNFFADNVEQHIGFMGHNRPGEIRYIGIYNGGCNGPYDLYVDENAWCYKRFTNDTATKSAIIFADNVKDILKFLEEFERFEQAFYNWIDSFDAE